MCHRSIFTCRNSSKKNIEDKIKRNVCNHPTPKVHIYLQKHLKKDENIKRNACNHPTPKVHICLQKQLKIDENIKINPCNHPTLKVLIHLQKQLKVDDKIKINPCKHLTSKVLIYYIYIIYICTISSKYWMPSILGTPSHEVMKSSSNTEPGFPWPCQWLLTCLSKSGIWAEITSSTTLNTWDWPADGDLHPWINREFVDVLRTSRIWDDLKLHQRISLKMNKNKIYLYLTMLYILYRFI